MAPRLHLTIGEVLSLLREEFPDVSISKIRFLESQGLVDPERTPSGYRKFYDHDVERLRWILLQQKEHFLPLKVIRDRLDTDVAVGEGSGAGERSVAPLPAAGADPATPPAPAAPVGAAAGTPAPGGAGPGGAGPGGAGPGDAAPGSAAPVGAVPGGAQPGGAQPGDAAPGGAAPVGAVPGAALAAPTVLATAAVPGAHASPGPPSPAGPGGSGSVPSGSGAAADAAPGGAAPAGGVSPVGGAGPAPSPPAARRAPPRPARPVPEDPPAPEPAGDAEGGQDAYTAAELAEQVGCTPELIRELEQFGILKAGATVGGVAYFDPGALGTARVGARFAELGVEPRHLRTWRNAADREAGLFEQLVMPLLRQRNPTARQQAVGRLQELIELGGQLRRGLVAEAVRTIG